jgi:small subunit ribosomal protein S6
MPLDLTTAICYDFTCINPCSLIWGPSSPKGGESMPLYEVMFIVQPDLEGEELEGAINAVKELVEKENGEVLSVKKMGKRKMAYEIKDFKEGFYTILNLQAPSEVVAALDHFFKVNEGYLRYIVVRMHEEKKKQKNEEEVPQNVQETNVGE